MQEITTQYHGMIAEATRNYEDRLAQANTFYYNEMRKLHENMSQQAENLMSSLANLSTVGDEPKDAT